MSAEDVAALPENAVLIALGEGDDRLLATDFGPQGSGLGSLIPGARVVEIAPAAHFRALPACKPAGAAILEEETDYPVCTDPPGTDRGAVHAEIVDVVAEALGR